MNKLVATTLESKFYVFDVRTQHPTKGFASVTEKVRLNVFLLWSIEFNCDKRYTFSKKAYAVKLV